PLSMLKLALKGLRTSGPMAPEIDMSTAREAEEHHTRLVAKEMARLKREAA
ncbi:MAG: hopanoid biosynthesis associated radical SAM protein HpnH, partial [Pseudomonadota bacterium]